MSAGAEPDYVLGHSVRELHRLQVQAHLVDPITRRLFVEAGIRSGMRVLDVGSGVGDVAFLLSELVGESGEVVGTDRSATALEVARSRAEERSLRNVSFREGDPAELTFERPFDAVAGRYVLMYQPDPVQMVRRVAAHARADGVIAFHEPYRGGIRSYPPVSSYDTAWELVTDVMERLGADTSMGIKLHSTFVKAGLPSPSMRLESVIAGGRTSADHVHFEMDVVATVLPELERLGLATESDVDVETLADRVWAEAAANDSIIVGRAEIGAWSRAPAR
jgi:SAM-dependent methyltransferase